MVVADILSFYYDGGSLVWLAPSPSVTEAVYFKVVHPVLCLSEIQERTS